ncbi:competence protein ComEA [Actinacidiphila yanglinensis]|uniref:Competence protein ComEA n=1 Tax=Actinacidiphila yanglinensis TaxID=310779 RepID=A0A1H6DP01_9ACTN|nr:ComEA family DNA-binding protein [Actinacidiphila yanglinensis]SEG86255.1 competence protein ComEA [Actinacidiphila yanglinensis]
MDLLDSLDSLNSLDRPEASEAPGPSSSGRDARGRAGGSAGAAGPIRSGGAQAGAAAARERAAAIFGTAREGPPGAARADAPRLAPPVAGAPVFGTGPLGRMRAWLFVRCGLELKTVLALGVVLVVAAGLAVQHYWAGRPRSVRVPPPPAIAAAPPSASPPPPPELTVDIAGKVARPGLRHLRKGARVADALTAAGGPLPGTDTTALNLARPLADGEQILVGIAPPPSTADAGTGTSAGAAASGGSPASPLHLNTATEPQLDALPGVGPVTAQRILTYRTQHGAFTSPGQLQQIPGIGPRRFATLQPLVAP